MADSSQTAAFAPGTDANLTSFVNSLHAPVTNPQAPTTTPVPSPDPKTTSQSTTQAPAAQTAASTSNSAAPTSVVDILNSLGQDSSYTGRAQLAQQLGIQHYTGSASQNTQLASKYQNYFNTVKGTTAPTSNPSSDIQTAVAPAVSSDPVFNSYAGMMAPIMKSLTQVMQDINNPAITGANLQVEYNTLAQQNKLPELQTQMLNMQNIMNGTTDDIRNEITSAGGTATESQVQAMSSARNNVILKQYNALSSQFQAAQTNVNNIMQYATSDQQTALAKQQATAGIVENMASIGAQIQQMGMTMQQNAKQAVQYNVTQTGYTGLAASAQGDTQTLGYYEQMLNLAPGTLSNPTSLAALDTYKQQQLAISEQNAQNAGQRTIIYAAAQGYPLGGTTAIGGNGTVTADGSTAPVSIDTNSLVRPSFVGANVPLSMSAADAQSMIAGAPKGVITSGGSAGTNAYGNNITVQGVGNYVAQPDGSYILGSALPPAPTTPIPALVSSVMTPGQKVPVMNYTDIKAVEAAAPASSLSPTSSAFSKETLAVKRLLQYQVTSPAYETISQAPLPFARIQAAKNGNNSVSDTELLDSYITLAKGKGQITEAQISAITGASSMSDRLNIIKQKVSDAGALISSDQRASLLALSGSVFDQYATTYQTVYTQGINVLAQNHIAPSFWGVMPDFTELFKGADLSSQQLTTPGL